MTTYRSRELTQPLLNALTDMPVVVVTGMRQVGKSTLLQEDPILKKRRYITLDDFPQLEAARRDPESLLGGDDPVTVDEAQKSPELLTVIKRMVDRNRTPGRFLLSGSANFALLKGIAETLAGRAIYFILHPFTRREILGKTGSPPFLIRLFQSLDPAGKSASPLASREILSGGMPPVCLAAVRQAALWFRGYEQTYIDRDLRQLSQVADLLSFRHLLQLTALRSGHILKLSELGRDAKLTSATASRYLGLMETSFLIQRVGPYLGNRAARLIKSPKLYLSDSGLACHLSGIDSLDITADEPLRGAMFETYVAQNLAGILDAHWPDARLLFWNVQGRYEVDFVIESRRQVMAIEVKAAGRWTEGDLSGLKAFLDKTPNCRAAILAYNGTQSVQLGKRLWAIPLGLLLS
ncbi:MAG: ATP-binding protein [Nitrospirae bacterium]|nr:ATP-binding protein [Nitrospirota bacterium]